LAVGDNAGLRVLPGAGNGTLGAAIVSAVGPPIWIGEPGDFNRDGALDLPVSGWSASNNGLFVGVALGDGHGHFGAPSMAAGVAGGDPNSLSTGDLNGDARPDL